MKWVILIPVLVFMGLLGADRLEVHKAHALSNREGKPGIFAEQSIAVDGVMVRRLHDSSNGTVCFLASAPDKAPAISCVGWQP